MKLSKKKASGKLTVSDTSNVPAAFDAASG